jgi:hypothetical protein
MRRRGVRLSEREGGRRKALTICAEEEGAVAQGTVPLNMVDFLFDL